jgi:anti-sigma B factor antagonist
MADIDKGAADLDVHTRIDSAGVPIVGLAGELDTSNAATLEAALAPILAERPALLIFDLGELRFMDSAGISVMVGAAAKVDRLQIRDPSPIVRRIVEITGLSEVLRPVP